MRPKKRSMVEAILRVFSVLPLRVNHLIGSLVGRYLYLTNTESRRVVMANIELCFPDMSPQDMKILVKKNLIETGKGLTESGPIWFNDFAVNSKCVKEINGVGNLESDKPIILLVPHFGCWEITGRVLSLVRPVTFLYKPLKRRYFEKLLFSRRQQGGLDMAAADKKGVIKIQRAINSNKVIGILPDQDPGEEGSVMAPFFNHKVRTMTLLVRLARKHDATVLLTWAERLHQGKGYKLNLKKINVVSEENTLESDVGLMNHEIENLIKTNPEQYLFNYKRFKSILKY